MKTQTVICMAVLIAAVTGHEYYAGQCPNFTPMAGFDWAQFSSGVWYVTHKFATKSSCLTYQFLTDELGFKSIKQERKLPGSNEVGVDNKYIYTGKLFAPPESSPAKMIVQFPLNVVGSSSFVVLDAVYDKSALLCTCQDFDLFFAYAHRRSCSILQRSQEEDPEITANMKKLLDNDLKDEDKEASHDFDKIKQADCNYGKDKAITIDVDKILGLGKGNTGEEYYSDVYGEYGGLEPDAEVLSESQIRDAVESVASEFEFNKQPLNQVKEEAKKVVQV